MGIKFSIDPSKLFAPLLKSITRSATNGLDKSSLFMVKQFDLVFENEGDKNVNNRGFGFQMFDPTTRAAKKGRKSFPRGGGRTGKKGFTQKQAQYLFAAPSLVDTGKMRSSLAIEEDGNTRYIGVGVPYIQTHEEGGTISVDGKTFDVPSRPFQHITDQEMAQIDKIMIAAFK